MSGAPPRPLPGHLFPLPVQWFAQDHPRVYGAITGAFAGAAVLPGSVAVLLDDPSGLLSTVLWVLMPLTAVALFALGAWSVRRDLRGAVPDVDRARFREAQRLVREGRPCGEAATDRAALRYARLVVEAPLGLHAQSLLMAALLALSLLSGGLQITGGRPSFAVFHATVAAVSLLYLAVALPVIEHRRRRARALLSLLPGPDTEEHP
ncbi:hypothetical protein SAMN05421803_10967 [Nocardiopsis flavescens]|uniref:Uncharacterized protein n=1 Tax=Nocardiopsis flavescens TaxID=758803 RepID=A0A1M6LUS1_9ACTN|nr:hypothetical protein [Nocardiopsis flavescens]SHJ74930.1 hypothetical protein SAMN05421803_10967 [Nocardiopsis flavescens]